MRHAHRQTRRNKSVRNGLGKYVYTLLYRCSITANQETSTSDRQRIKGKNAYPTGHIITPTNRPLPIYIQTPNAALMPPQTPNRPPPLYIPHPDSPVPRPRHCDRTAMQYPHTPNGGRVPGECVYAVSEWRVNGQGREEMDGESEREENTYPDLTSQTLTTLSHPPLTTRAFG